MKDFLEFIQKNWNVVKDAPLIFSVLMLLAFSLVFVVLKWYYDGLLQTLKERIAAKDDQINEYRQRLHLVSAIGTRYSSLTDAELQREALRVTDQVRQFLDSAKREENQVFMSNQMQMTQEKSKEELIQDVLRGGNAAMQITLKATSEYDSRFKTDTILLRDELLSRLPKEMKSQRVYNRYEHPVNRLAIEDIASDLEILAKSLPK